MTNLLTSILFAMNAALWGYRSWQEGSLFYLILAAVWLWGAVVWLIRYFKKRG